jgi:hypothetical protein
MSDVNAACATAMTDHVEQFWRELDTNQVRILVELKRDGYWDSSSFNDEVSVALVEKRIAARSTIAEQEKRIGIAEGALLRAQHEIENTRHALTSERQRCAEAETVLRPFARNAAAMRFRNADPNTGIETSLCTGADEECLFTVGEMADARDHFRKYEASNG